MCCFSLNVLSLWLSGRLRRQRCGFQAAVPPVTGWHQGQQAGDEPAALCRPGKHPQRVYGMLTGAWRLAPYYVIQELEQNRGVKVLYSCLNLLFVLVWVVLWCYCLRSNLIIFMEKDILFGDLWCFFWNNDQLSAESPLIESILVCFPKWFVFIHLQQSL